MRKCLEGIFPSVPGGSTGQALNHPKHTKPIVAGEPIHNWFGGLEHDFYFPSYIGDVILPIDEVHHFSRWLLHHQPDKYSLFLDAQSFLYIPTFYGLIATSRFCTFAGFNKWGV